MAEAEVQRLVLLYCLTDVWSLGSPCTTSGLERRGGSQVLGVVTVMVKE